MGSIIDNFISFVKRKISKKHRFNLQYEKKQWDGLRSVEDLGRYSIIVGYVRFFAQDARILDLGCGEGVLQERISANNYTQYLGVDISDVAIANAQEKADTKTKFITGDLQRLQLDGTFNVIVYNESIYYLKDPKASVLSLIKNLTPNGIFIISCYNRHGREHTTLWEGLADIVDLADRVTVSNAKGDTWAIHVYTVKR